MTETDPYISGHEVGQDNLQMFGMDLHNPVFFISAGLILLFVIGTLMFPTEANSMLDGAKGWSIQNFDWLFIWAGNLFVVESNGHRVRRRRPPAGRVAPREELHERPLQQRQGEDLRPPPQRHVRQSRPVRGQPRAWGWAGRQ